MDRRHRLQRGITIIENMMAMSLFLIGVSGALAVNRQSSLYLGDARKITRASAFAGDLATQIQLWDFTDPRLANTNVANDDDVGDSTRQFELPGAPPADHGEADLAGVPVLPNDLLVQNGMERYWNVSLNNVDFNGNGVPDAMRIAVIVRWQAAGGWRRIVIPIVKVNPAERM
jgi:hypothetical protein